jgi:hypothetical protein
VAQGLAINTSLGIPHPYVSFDFRQNQDLLGDVTMVSVEVFDSWGGVEADDGYEIIVANFIITFTGYG